MSGPKVLTTVVVLLQKVTTLESKLRSLWAASAPAQAHDIIELKDWALK